MSKKSRKQVSFDQVLAALLDTNQPFRPAFCTVSPISALRIWSV